ncbi:MAG: hypothetical protein NVS1B7_0950 [Candidatus Saccharimonadales bacterium]
MTAKPSVGQGMLWTPEDLPTPQFEELGIPGNQIISMSRLLKSVSTAMALPTSYSTVEEFDQSTPATIHPHLYIDKTERRAKTAENLFMGIVHPSQEFRDISKSPEQLARHVKNKTRNSYKLEEVIVHGTTVTTLRDKDGIEVDRDEVHARVQRSAGHALHEYVSKIEMQDRTLQTQHLDLDALMKELKSPGRAHYKAENLNRLRVVGEQAIRESIEVASINAHWPSLTVDGLHKAAMYKIYGMPGHNNARLAYFMPWTMLARNWTRARQHNIQTALRNCQKEYNKYVPDLNATQPII